MRWFVYVLYYQTVELTNVNNVNSSNSYIIRTYILVSKISRNTYVIQELINKVTNLFRLPGALTNRTKLVKWVWFVELESFAIYEVLSLYYIWLIFGYRFELHFRRHLESVFIFKKCCFLSLNSLHWISVITEICCNSPY